MSAERLAKLSQPTTPHAVVRTRLHQRLDELRDRSVLWVRGPPGCGKTTLVATYLKAQGIGALWYQADSGDSDLAALFYYLGAAARPFKPKAAVALPRLLPDHLPRLEQFTRKFARALYARIGPEAYLVFDNFHEIPQDAESHRVLNWLFSEIPAGVHAIVMSREQPPKQYSQALANSAIGELNWHDLQFTWDETLAMAYARGVSAPEALHLIHERSDGWAAGVVLLLEGVKQTGPLGTLDGTSSIDRVFDYIDTSVFSRLDEDEQAVLIRTSALPFVNGALALSLTGRDDVLAILKQLHYRQFLVHRSKGRGATFQYHSLLRAFLDRQAQQRFTPTEWEEWLRQSAQALLNHGLEEEALAVYSRARLWKHAVRLIQALAPRLIGQGRWQTVLQWIESVPEAPHATEPWLSYWLGICWLRRDPLVARQHLERAFEAFGEISETVGQLLAAATIIEAHITEWADCNPLDRWIDVIEQILTPSFAFPNLEAELTVRASLLNACMHRQKTRSDLSGMAHSVMALLEYPIDPDLKIGAARAVLVYGAHTGEFRLLERLVQLSRSAFAVEEASPVNRAWYAARVAWAMRFVMPPSECRAWLDDAHEIAKHHNLVSMEAPIAALRIWVEEVAGDQDAQRQSLRVIEEFANPKSTHETAFIQVSRMFVSIAQHDLDTATVQGREALAMFRRGGYNYGVAFISVGLAFLYLRRNCIDQARETCHELMALEAHGPLFRYLILLIRTLIALRAYDEQTAIVYLREAFGMGAEHGFWGVLGEAAYRPLVVELAVFALANGIALDYVHRVIEKQHLPAPFLTAASWPWPLRARGLGRFSLEYQGQPLEFPGKTPKKPVELLKVLVAMGHAGANVTWISAQLWPDAEGDSAANAFRVNHLRLRKLLPSSDWLIFNDGNLRLNTAYVWTDVSAFEAQAAECLAHLQVGADPAVLAANEHRLLDWYQGDLFEHEPAVAWMIGARERLRLKFFRCLKGLGAAWEAKRDWEHAQQIYEQALERDPTAEVFYRRLMMCYFEGGYPTEALRIYRRCQSTLSRSFGSAPSADTEALYHRILATRANG